MATINKSALTLTFDDEFNSLVASPDGSVGWMTAYPFGGRQVRTLTNNKELEYYSDSSVGVNPFQVKDGILDITAAPSAANPLGLPYTSGLVTSFRSFSQTYGYFEMRAKLPAGAGLWPAFWLLPTDNKGMSELDVMEQHGSDPTVTYQTAISVGLGTMVQTVTHGADTSTGFHTYGVDWEQDTLTYYFDGVAISTIATPANMNTPMYMLVNLAVGGPGTWAGTPDATTAFPARMEVDYVRAYATQGTLSVAGPEAVTGLPLPQAAPPTSGTARLTASAAPAGPLPSIHGTITGQAVPDQLSPSPFANVTIHGTGAVNVTVTMSNPANGTFSMLGGGRYDPAHGVYSLSGTEVEVTAALQRLVFTPSAAMTPHDGDAATTSFAIAVADAIGNASDNETTLRVEHGRYTGYGQELDEGLMAGTAPLRFTDAVGTNVITGDQRGLALTIAAVNDVVTTAAGSANTLQLDAAGTTVNSRGTDVIRASQGGQTIVASGAATIEGAGGGNVYTLSGTARLASAGTDTITVTGGTVGVTASGPSVSAVVQGGSLTLTESGAGDDEQAVLSGTGTISAGAGRGALTVTVGPGARLQLGQGASTVTAGSDAVVSAGSGTLTLSGARLTLNQGSGATTLQGSRSATVVNGGSGLLTMNQSSSTLQVNGPQTLVLTGWSSVVTGSASGLLTVTDLHGGNTIAGGAGGLAATIRGTMDTITAAGAATVTLVGAWGTSVTGGAGLLTVTDDNMGNTITGGSGGLNALITGLWGDTISTAAGSANCLTLLHTGNVVTSRGTDMITATAGAQTITASGTATIDGSAERNTYRLSGIVALTSRGTDAISVTGGVSTIQALGALATVTLTGGTVSLSTSSAPGSVRVVGTATLTGGSSTAGVFVNAGAAADVITVLGGRVTVSGTGANTILAENGTLVLSGATSASTVRAGAGNLVLSGMPATLVQGSGITTLQGGSGKGTVLGGSGLINLAQTYTTLTVQGAQAFAVTGFANVLRGGDGLLVVNDAHGQNTIAGGAGGLVATVRGNGETITAAAAATVALIGSYGSSVIGGSGLLTVTDDLAATRIVGGSGGILASLAGQRDSITTQAGSRNTIQLSGGYATVSSNGFDTITAAASNQTITATGAATINGAAGYNTYNLSGTVTLASAGNDRVNLSGGTSAIKASGAAITIAQTGGTMTLVEDGGATSVSVSGAATTVGGPAAGATVTTQAAGASTVRLSLGNDTVLSNGRDMIFAGTGSDVVHIYGSATVQGGSGAVTVYGKGSGMSFIAGSGIAKVVEVSSGSQVQFGTGTTTVYGSAAASTYSFVNGQGGGTDIINMFTPGQDRLVFSGFAGSPIESQTVSGGSLYVVLTDHTHLTLVGVSQPLGV